MPTGRYSRRPCRSLALHNLPLSLSYQAQPATRTANEKQRIEIVLALTQSPVQATLTVSTRAEHPDHLSKRHAFADAQCADHRLVCGADATVINADHWFAGDRSDEGHYAARGRKNCLTGLSDKINTTMARSPHNRRGIEPSPHHGRAVQRPAGRRRQLRSRVSGSWKSEHTEADQNEECQPNVSAKCSHAWSLRIIALIVQRFGNLWMPLVGPPSAVDNPRRSSSGSDT
jgi:hypothetical protein